MCFASLCLSHTHAHVSRLSLARFLNDARNLCRPWVLCFQVSFFCYCRSIWLLDRFCLSRPLETESDCSLNERRRFKRWRSSNYPSRLYSLQPLPIFDDVWNGIRFIRWDLERRGKITDLHIRRLLSYSMFRVSLIVSINTHTHTSDHLLIMMRSTFERFTIRFRCREEKKYVAHQSILICID